MDVINFLRAFIKMIAQYGIFGSTEFEFLEIDQRPDFYAGIFTARPKEE